MANKQKSKHRFVHTERSGPLAVVRFSSDGDGMIPIKGAVQFIEEFTALFRDNSVRVIILTGSEPGLFIRHASVRQELKIADMMASGEIKVDDFAQNPFMDLVRLLQNAPKPVIAAIDGLCMGGGLEIALACQMRIASPKATSIGLPEIRIDLVPGGGGLHSLERIVGQHKAMLYSLLGTLFTAEEALAAGIVDEVAPSAFDRAMEVASIIATRVPATVSTLLRLARERASLDDTSRACGVLMHDEPAVRERLRRFVDQEERLDQVS